MRISDWSSDVCSSDLVGAEVWLKFENLQFTAAYKERGALNALLLLDDEAKSRGVIAASAGNHAQGLAYHGKRLGVPVTIVMPKTTPQVKVSQTASHGAEIVLFGETDWKTGVVGKRVEVSVMFGGRPIMKKKKYDRLSIT